MIEFADTQLTIPNGDILDYERLQRTSFQCLNTFRVTFESDHVILRGSKDDIKTAIKWLGELGIL